MTLFKNEEILFSNSIILKGILRGLIFPFLLVIVFNVRDGGLSIGNSLAFFFLIAIPLLIIQSISMAKRCRYCLKEIALDEDKKTVILKYWDYRKEVSIENEISVFSILIRHDNWMRYNYVLEFRVNGQSVIKQCEEGSWTEEKMFDLLMTLSDTPIKCRYDTIDLKLRMSKG